MTHSAISTPSVLTGPIDNIILREPCWRCGEPCDLRPIAVCLTLKESNTDTVLASCSCNIFLLPLDKLHEQAEKGNIIAVISGTKNADFNVIRARNLWYLCHRWIARKVNGKMPISIFFPLRRKPRNYIAWKEWLPNLLINVCCLLWYVSCSQLSTCKRVIMRGTFLVMFQVMDIIRRWVINSGIQKENILELLTLFMPEIWKCNSSR